ncbi:MAG: hypothetical protein WD873_02710 [Candidatus Hydrogenedentales bacterium]
MDVVIDGERFDGDTAGRTVPQLLGEIDAQLRARGRGILSIRLDGRHVTPEALPAALSGRTPQNVARLEIESDDMLALAEENIAHIKEVLPELPVACHELAAVFHSTTPDRGYEQFKQLAEIWSSLKEQEQQIAAALDVEMSGLVVGRQTLDVRHAELNRCLEEAAAALEVRDTVLLGDLLEYELAPFAETEIALIDELEARVRERRG